MIAEYICEDCENVFKMNKVLVKCPVCNSYNVSGVSDYMFELEKEKLLKKIAEWGSGKDFDVLKKEFHTYTLENK